MVGIPHNEVTNVLDCDIQVTELELQLCYDVHSRTNNNRKCINLVNPRDMS